MERSGTLLNRKYRNLLVSTLAMTASLYLAAIVDGIMVGQLLGTEQLSAINLTTSISFLKSIPVAIFTFGGNTLAVMYKGKRDNRAADAVYTLSFCGAMLSTLIVTAAGIALIDPTAALLSQGTSLQPLVASYLLPLWAVTPLVAFTTFVASFARTDGMKRLATAIPIVSNVINLLCNYLFMVELRMGIAGAGWATVAGYALGSLLVIGFYRSKKRSVSLSRAALEKLGYLKDIIGTGMPSALIYVCNFVRLFATNAIILSATDVMGAKIASVTFSLNSLAFIFVEGASMTLLPILGALYGEKDIRGQKLALRYGTIFTFLLCMAVFAVSMALPDQLASLYGLTDESALEIFRVTFRLVTLNIPLLCLIYVLRSLFQATKQKMLANILVILDGALVIVPLMWALSKAGPYWMWASFPLSKLITILIMLIVLLIFKHRKGKDNLLMLDREEGRMLDFSIRNETSEALKAAKSVKEFCLENGVGGTVANAVAVSTEELCYNIACYAKSPTSDTIDVCVRIFDDKVTLRLRDNGRMFDPTGYLDDSGEMITGLQLVRALTSHIEHSRVLDFNLTVVTVDFTRT